MPFKFNSSSRSSKRWKPTKDTYCLGVFAFFCLSCIVAGVGVGYGLRVKRFHGDDLERNGNERTLSVEAELISVDPIASTLVMNWYIAADTCLDGSVDCTPVSIFFDPNLLQLRNDDADTNKTNLPATEPIFTYYPLPPETVNGPESVPVFRTTSLLFNRNNTEGPKPRTSLQDYPFDIYEAFLFVYGADLSTTNITYVNLEVSYSYGVAVGFKTVSNTTLSDDSVAYVNIVTLERGGLIKAYVLFIVAGVWLVTITFVGSVMKIMFGYKQPKEVFAVPIATLFAFTSLRGTMPGAPAGFGATIDFVGILPCLAIITIAGVILFAYMVVSNHDGTKFEPALFNSSKNGEDDSKIIVDAEQADGNSTPALNGAVSTPSLLKPQDALAYEPLDLTNIRS